MANAKSLELGNGIGVGDPPAYQEAFFSGEAAKSVSWIEVITENFLPGESDSRALQSLRRIRDDFPVALHGVGLSLASTDPLSERYLQQLSALSERIEPWLVTDHLCWTGVNQDNLFDLLPFPFSREALDLVAGKISRVQDLLKRPMAVENITFYAHPRGDEMREEEFLNELCRRTGCRILFDVNNIYVNAVNFGLDPLDYIRRLNLKNVAEIHVAGHFERGDGLLIDTHGAPVKREVWELYEKVIALGGLIPTMIERDQNIPAWSEMEAELAHLRSLRKGGARAITRLAEAIP
ncbi:MAG: DUF692 domain-containing protein [Bdellovibrionota bacterium]